MHPDKAPHISVVVSPLRALMHSMNEYCAAHSISAACIWKMAEMTPEDIKVIKSGSVNVVFTSPEALTSKDLPWADAIQHHHERVCLLAVDEAHCVADWGETIRPAYQSLTLLQSWVGAPWLLATATATSEVLKQVLKTLRLQHKQWEVVARLPDRPGIKLFFKSRPGTGFADLQPYVTQLRQLGKKAPKAIVFCKTLNQVGNLYEDIATALGPAVFFQQQEGSQRKQATKRLVGAYHGTPGSHSEKYFLSEFPKVTSNVRLMICTVAFGMGVNIPDVKYIFHYGISKNILSYWQEVGRAGRDGQPAEAHMLAIAASKYQNPKPDKEILDLVDRLGAGEVCMREEILKCLTVQDMDLKVLEDLQNRSVCDRQCTEDCQCAQCKCCSLCEQKCPCRG